MSCAKQLETAFRSDRDIAHFLRQEEFITEEVYNDVSNPRLLGEYQKARELVTGIRNKVELSAQNYYTILNHLRQGGKKYRSIVSILDEEYSRQQQTGK